MIREILKMGDPRLLRIADPVDHFGTPQLHELVKDMFETMHHANGAGFGSNERYPDAPPVPETVLINPTITPVSLDMEEGWEGCLSVPGLRGAVSRFSMIKYHGFDQYGTPIDRVAEGFHARVVQHECDHLIGKLYPMRITDFAKFGFTEVLFPDLDPNSDD
jgi:peptide deformylase